jgi:hypothetical protein
MVDNKPTKRVLISSMRATNTTHNILRDLIDLLALNQSYI